MKNTLPCRFVIDVFMRMTSESRSDISQLRSSVERSLSRRNQNRSPSRVRGKLLGQANCD